MCRKGTSSRIKLLPIKCSLTILYTKVAFSNCSAWKNPWHYFLGVREPMLKMIISTAHGTLVWAVNWRHNNKKKKCYTYHIWFPKWIISWQPCPMCQHNFFVVNQITMEENVDSENFSVLLHWWSVAKWVVKCTFILVVSRKMTRFL